MSELEVIEKHEWGNTPEEQLPNEKSQAYEWFLLYLYTPARSVPKIMDRIDDMRENDADNENIPQHTTVTGWSQRYSWVKRSKHFDSIQRQEATDSLKKEHQAQYEKFFVVDLKMNTLLQEQLKKEIENIEDIDDDALRIMSIYRLSKSHEVVRTNTMESLGIYIDKQRKELEDKDEAQAIASSRHIGEDTQEE